MWSAAILAGGRARRLGGQDKSALIVDGVRLLDRQLAALHSLTDTILLVGYPGPAPASCVVVPDHRPGTGPLGAIASALSVATTERVLIVAVDLPFLTTAFLDFLARADEDADAVVPVSGGRWQPLCAMYRRRGRARSRRCHRSRRTGGPHSRRAPEPDADLWRLAGAVRSGAPVVRQHQYAGRPRSLGRGRRPESYRSP
jgi:molybdopterin-guanine dinucleotide biosynthesis protein A